MRSFLYIILACVISGFITAKYIVPQGGGVTVEKPQETTFERIQRTRTLRCGYYIVASLFRKNEKTGQFSGPAFDIVNTMANNLKLKVEWVAEVALPNLSEDLKNGRFDMLCVPIATNAARGQVMSVSKKYFLHHFIFIYAQTIHAMKRV